LTARASGALSEGALAGALAIVAPTLTPGVAVWALGFANPSHGIATMKIPPNFNSFLARKAVNVCVSLVGVDQPDNTHRKGKEIPKQPHGTLL